MTAVAAPAIKGFFIGRYLRYSADGRVQIPESLTHRIALWATLFVFVTCFYGFFLFFCNLFGSDLGLTFNSMLLHLLHGEFNVDPNAIGLEGFIRDGKVYAYFGILPALLRLPLLPFLDLTTTDVTAPSCLLAASIAAC